MDIEKQKTSIWQRDLAYPEKKWQTSPTVDGERKSVRNASIVFLVFLFLSLSLGIWGASETGEWAGFNQFFLLLITVPVTICSAVITLIRFIKLQTLKRQG